MKTALDLPDELFIRIKVRAAQQGRKLKDVVAELLQRGLDGPIEAAAPCKGFSIDPQTGLPLIVGLDAAPPSKQLTPEMVAQILLDQEVAWFLEASR